MEATEGGKLRRIGKDKPSILDDPIAKVLGEMKAYDPDSDEYKSAIAHLERLMRLKAEEGHNSRISPDTLAIVAGNLLGILIIVIYEQRHVMVSKGLGMILRPKQSGI